MDKLSKVKLLNDMIVILNRDCKDHYLHLLGECVLNGMEIETAIYKCWNDLIVPTLKTYQNG